MIKQWLLKFARHERGAMWVDWSSEVPFKDHICGGIIYPMERWVLLGKTLQFEADPLWDRGMKYKNPVDFVRYKQQHNNWESRPKDLKGEALENARKRLSENKLAEEPSHAPRH